MLKKWPLNLWWISSKSIIEVRNITKAATFNNLLHLSYKYTQLLFLWQCFFVTIEYFHETNINWWFWGVTQKYELRVSFKMTVYFTKNDDLILFHFDMKELNVFNFLYIKMMKISFEISDSNVLSWRQREICILVYVFR